MLPLKNVLGMAVPFYSVSFSLTEVTLKERVFEKNVSAFLLLLFNVLLMQSRRHKLFLFLHHSALF